MKHESNILLVISAIIAIIISAPTYITIVGSFTPIGEIYSPHITFLPKTPTLKNYIDLLFLTSFPMWLLNSIFVALCFTVLGIIFCSMAGYAFSRLRFRGRDSMFFIMIASMAIPEFITVVPNFILLNKLGWVNTYFALIIPFCAHPFAIFLAKQYMETVPPDILDSSRIDGCTEFQTFYKIVLPIVRPVIGAIAIFLFVHSWNAYLYPLVLMQDMEMFTVPLGLAMLGSTMEYPQQTVDFTAVLAGVTISIVPIMLLFASMQKEFIAGLTGGAVKGYG